MAKYVYHAIFKKEENGQYSVSFPDVGGCFTNGDDIIDAIEMAKDALCLMLYDKEEDGESIPAPTYPLEIKTDENSFVSLVNCDTLEYRRFNNKKSVKKTLTIPVWLNYQAEKANAPFSQILQQGLKEFLQIAE
jgi:predicted RNase H-like HicB family nuclease